MKFIIKLFYLFLYAQIISMSFAQPLETKGYPEIGKPLPDFALHHIQYDKRENATLKDFKGKWLVIDFFSVGCTACFESFPKINQMKKDLEGKVEIILVGSGDKYTPPAYEKASHRQNLKLPVAYDSGTVLFKQYGIKSVPYVIVADNNGIVRAITDRIHKEDLELFLNGNDPKLRKIMNVAQFEENMKRYDYKKPLLINGNGGVDTVFLFRSILAPYNGIHYINQDFVSVRYFGNRVQLVGLPIQKLYDYAYGDTTFRSPDDRGNSYGEYWRTPLLEIKDSTKIMHRSASEGTDDFGENLYNYSLIVPRDKASGRYLQSAMQNDLKNYFGYDVVVETRLMPCWKLIATDKARKELITKGISKEPKEYPYHGGFSLINRPVRVLIHEIWSYHQLEPPFIDETGITSNIDLEVDAILTDLKDFRNSLRKNGLDLVKGKKEMKVIVIRDPKHD